MPPDQTVNPIVHLLPPILIFMIFYFLLIKPQKEKQNQQKQMLSHLKKNDQVVTSSGIHGTIVNLKDTTVVIRIDDNARIEVDKEAIATIKGSAEKTASA